MSLTQDRYSLVLYDGADCTYDSYIESRRNGGLRVIGGVGRSYFRIEDKNRSSEAVAKFSSILGYNYCCGLREIGYFGSTWIPMEDVRSLYILFCTDLRMLSGDSFGAYTLTEHADEECNSLLPRWIIKLLAYWPDASAGNWFYNPNSENNVRIWTLPLPNKE